MRLHILLTVFIYLHITSAASSHTRVLRQTSTTCTTPDSQRGTCIILNNCSSLLSLLTTRGRETVVVNFLRQSQCGTQNGSPKVCCPTSGSPKVPSSTSSTSGSRTGVTQPRPITSPTTTTSLPTPESPLNTNPYAECGVSPLSAPRIVDGVNASLGDFPWIAALGYKVPSKTTIEYSCGGSLISDSWVITAGHCIVSNWELTTVRLGELNMNPAVADRANPIDVPVAEIIRHPSYSGSPIENDIALLRLKNPVTFTQYIRPICILQLPEHRNSSFYDNKQPFIVGWGRNASNALRGVDHLQYTQIKVTPLTKCKQQYASVRGGTIDEKIICAGDSKKDACQGDSGGPLIIPYILGKTKYYLAGIVSFGIGCGNTSVYPGVYTKVAVFIDWIEKTINSRNVL